MRYAYLNIWPSKSKVIGEVKVPSHKVSPTYYRLTSISFHVDLPSHTWDAALSKFNIKNLRSVSYSRSHSEVNILSTFLSFHVNCSPSPEIKLFQNLILKIQAQDHGWGQSSNSQSGSDFLLTLIPFIPCQSAIPFLGYGFYQIWPWKREVEVIVQGPTSYGLTSLLFYVNRP